MNRDDEIEPLPNQIVDLTEILPVELEPLLPEKPMRVIPTRVTLPKKTPRKFENLEKQPSVTKISIREVSLQEQTLKEDSGSQGLMPLVLGES